MFVILPECTEERCSDETISGSACFHFHWSFHLNTVVRPTVRQKVKKPSPTFLATKGYNCKSILKGKRKIQKRNNGEGQFS